jgi:iron(III) transport system ATP-binding protein
MKPEKIMATALKEKPGEASGVTPKPEAAPVDYAVRLEMVGKMFGNAAAVKDVSFALPVGQTLTLLGPSGCGKTTTLRCIAGLETPTSGLISVAGRPVYDAAAGIAVEPEKRQIGMVFQSYAIWPHMTVGGNVGFPLEIQRVSRAETRERVEKILDLVGLGNLYSRSASQLSGGQQQRVALARALVFEPRLVLFDEPLSNLDANLRDRMRTELQALQARLGFTAIYVTHDQEEALSLSDTVIVMKDGAIEQSGAPKEVFQNPATAFTAKFLGYSNIVTGEAAPNPKQGDNAVTVQAAGGISLNGFWRSREPRQNGEKATIAFRADAVTIGPAGKPARGANVLAGTVAAASFLGTCVDYTVSVGDLHIKAEGPVEPAFARGDEVSLTIPQEDCHVFRAD